MSKSFERELMTGGSRLALVAASMLVAAGLTGAAQAQQAPQQTAQATENKVEEIVVTGTRLGTTVENAQTPLQVITAEDFQIRGETALSDALQKTPALRFSLNTESSANEAGAIVGRTTLNLRAMGAARTLVLVNGRRHVAGVPGSASVDTQSIPAGLVERVDILTGGASAIYGSDAVTGVVNFILKKDFEGNQTEVQYEISDEGDGAKVYVSHLVGQNFAGGKGNFTIGAQYEDRNGIRYKDRPFTANNNTTATLTNPDLTYQVGDPLPPGVTPAQAIGRTILSGTNPRFANTPQALLDRARSAAPQRIGRDYRFAISTLGGLLAFDPFSDFAPRNSSVSLLDIDRNGVSDCQQSFIGRNVGPSFAGGCWVVDPATNEVRPFRDGLIADAINQFGGDGAPQSTDGDTLTPDTTHFSGHFTGRFEVSPYFRPYVEGKAVYNRGREYRFYNTFDDTILIRLDNPFIPASLRALANQEIAARRAANPAYNADDFLITMARDHTDIFDPLLQSTRRTYRGVVGFDGEFENGWTYDLSFNYGRTEQTTIEFDRVRDRFFAATDVTVDPRTGQPACRISVDGTRPLATFLDPQAFSPIAPISYNPADCRPLNLFGVGNSSEEALAFQRYRSEATALIQQSVASAVLIGDSEQLFSLPGGPIGFAIGGEWRKEESDFQPDELDRNGNAFERRRVSAVTGEFTVKEAFAEIGLPLLADLPFAKLLNVTAAGRVGDYSTIGSVNAWKVDGTYAPIDDIRFRASLSETIRAPNIAELFTGAQSVNSNPRDVCLQENINLGPNPAARLANCSAAFGRNLAVQPHNNRRTAQFAGTRAGNPNLTEETSESWTVGGVLTPSFLDGFSVAVDYWHIKIEDAIQAVTQNDIVASCYDAPSLDNPFCALFGRNLAGTPATNPQFGWINRILQTDINYAGLEAAGIDFEVNYGFDLENIGLPANAGSLFLNVSGTWVEKRNDFPFPSEPTRANPALGELDRPKWAGSGSATYEVDAWAFSWSSRYYGNTTLRGVQIETAREWTPAFTGSAWVHDASVRYDWSEKLTLIAGVNNVFERDPFFTEFSSPASALGRTMFLRVTASY